MTRSLAHPHLLACAAWVAAWAIPGCARPTVSPAEEPGARAPASVAAPFDASAPAPVAASAAPSKPGTFTVPYAIRPVAIGHAITLRVDQRTIRLRTGFARHTDAGCRVTLTSAEALPEGASPRDDELAKVADAIVSFTIPLPTALPSAIGDGFTFLSGMPIATDVVIGLRASKPGLASPFDFIRVAREAVRLRATHELPLIVDLSIDGAAVEGARVNARGSLAIRAPSLPANALQIVDLTTRVPNDVPSLATSERTSALPHAVLRIDPTTGSGRLSLSSAPLSCAIEGARPASAAVSVDVIGEGVDMTSADKIRDVSSTPQPVRAVADAGQVAPRGWIAFDDLSTKDGAIVHGHLALAAPTRWFAKTPERSPVTLRGSFAAKVCVR